MPASPPFANGFNVTYSIKPLVQGADGTYASPAGLSPTSKTLNGKWLTGSVNTSIASSNLSPSDIGQTNPVAYEIGATIALSELIDRTAIGSVLLWAFENGSHVEITAKWYDRNYTAASPVTRKTWVATCLITDGTWDSAKDRQVYNLTVQTVALSDGSPNPATS